MGKKPSLSSIIGLSLAPFTGGLSLAATAPDIIDGITPETPDLKVPEEADADAAAARERERARLASGGRPSQLSGGKKAALSANIGKRTLGGSV